ncbi:SixA phosphatase family protein [Pseudoalteromonas luteoviolacea]|uniref:SixA phosphatase family protein n=1 Tax=Pseudoalteromonas luteoviolacea TaxID=43657 RepID=UPI00159F1402|nr:phosphoglycerate mutase family protein [Pseudoalteromonas luteoviolacea]
MRTLRLIRHAKSSWKDPSLSDLERPLKNKGVKRASQLAQRLHSLPDTVFFSSPAKRALDTAKIIHRTCTPQSPLNIYSPLYTFCEHELLLAIQSFDERAHDCTDICVVAHNPALTLLTNHLCATNFENISTAGYVVIQSTSDCWGQLSATNCQYQDHLFIR